MLVLHSQVHSSLLHWGKCPLDFVSKVMGFIISQTKVISIFSHPSCLSSSSIHWQESYCIYNSFTEDHHHVQVSRSCPRNIQDGLQVSWQRRVFLCHKFSLVQPLDSAPPALPGSTLSKSHVCICHAASCLWVSAKACNSVNEELFHPGVWNSQNKFPLRLGSTVTLVTSRTQWGHTGWHPEKNKHQLMRHSPQVMYLCGKGKGIMQFSRMREEPN